MLINIVQFPKIKDGKDAEFRRWFADSNRAYASHPGFIRRILLQPREAGGHYAALVEHESHETFMAMHLSDERQALFGQVEKLIDGMPEPQFYNVVTTRRK